ncbi:MAG TPA: PfkB family carbohydrate kinase [Alphaproteobacteria bacterium]|jgi:sugar/nucleoside kinase (ribokinase family)|nr:PfkB family carbohydrate kinase [Alphaproteobacteria bacterium]
MSAGSACDVCVLGHVTRDVIRDGSGAARTQAGGAAYYGAAALARLGLRVGLVTKLAAGDEGLLRELRRLGVAVAVKNSAATTVFEAVRSENPEHRQYRALSVADPFAPSDLDGLHARAILMDPLTTHDGFAALMEKAAAVAPVIALDIQGFVRKFLIPGVPEKAVAAALAGLSHVTIVKADASEAAAIAGIVEPAAAARALARFGPREVIVTSGSKGSLVWAEGALAEIPAFAPKRMVDATGAGDSYLAGYVAARLEGHDPPQAARFGAAVASIKVGRSGAFAGTREDVAAVLARNGA